MPAGTPRAVQMQGTPKTAPHHEGHPHALGEVKKGWQMSATDTSRGCWTHKALHLRFGGPNAYSSSAARMLVLGVVKEKGRDTKPIIYVVLLWKHKSL